MSSGPKSKKEKKKLLRKKNRRIWEIFQHAEIHREQVERDGGLATPEVKKPSKPEKTALTIVEQQNTKSRLEEIRNRNTQRKMRAQEKWNRFAGTSDAGGRGL